MDIPICLEAFSAVAGNCAMISASASLASILIFRKRPGGDAQASRPPQIIPESRKTEMLMELVRELERRIDKIGIEDLDEEDRKWYNKMRLQTENIKKSIAGGDYGLAVRQLGDVELSLKMVEMNSAGGGF